MKPVIPKAPHIQDKRIWDLAAAAPLIILCVIAASGFAIKIQGQWPPHSGNSLLIGSEVSSAVFLLFQAGLLCVRRLPLSKMQGIAPRVWALAGANFSFLILPFPRVTPTPLEAFISSLLVLAGTLGSILSLIWLGRAFAIFPQARILVTAGPYTLVRHPLYLAEQISAFGLALQFQQPWGLLIVLVGFIFQFPRMHFEEKILAASFPAYRAYAGRTARILPFLY